MSAARAAAVAFAALLVSGCAASASQAQLLRIAQEADAAYRAGDFSLAKRKYEALLAARPHYAAAHVRLGAIAYAEGDAARAREAFERALEKDARNAQARYNLAMLSLNDAAAHLTQYVALAPDGPNRARALHMLARLRELGQSAPEASNGRVRM